MKNREEYRILIIDDEQHVVSMLKDALDSETNAVTTATDPGVALELFAENAFDIVITDIMMPKVRGTDVVAELKRREPFVQIIAITGYPVFDDIARMLTNGVGDFLVKPFPIEDVRERVAEAMQRARRWQDMRTLWHEKQKKPAE